MGGVELSIHSLCRRIDGGLGLSASPVLRWGLGAIIIMLIVSTAISLGKNLLPTILEAVNGGAAEGRSLALNDFSSLAQHAFDAIEKYQLLNEN